MTTQGASLSGPAAAGGDVDLPRDALAVLPRITQAISKHLEREPLFAAIAAAVEGVIPADRVIVLVPGGPRASVNILAVGGTVELRAGQSIPARSAAEWVMAHRQPAVVADREDARRRFPGTYHTLGQEGMESVVVLPLMSGERCLGALGFMARRPRTWEGVSMRLLDEIATSVAVAVGNCLAYEELQHFGHEQRVLLDVNRAVGRHLRRDDLFGALASCLRGLVPSERFGIELPVDGERLQAHVLGPLGPGAAPTRVELLPAAGTACQWVEQQHQPMVAAARAELRERFPVTFDVMQREGMESLCALPLLTGDRCRGVLFFMAAGQGAYDELRRGLFEQVAGAVAVALDNCLAHEEVEHLRDRLAAENVYLQEEIRQEHNFGEIIGRSPALHRVLAQIEVAAPTNATVLILGETGTGKELVARAIHDRSPRRARPLVKVNCAAISAGLVESELFGHVKGAFTGALSNRTGRFELADGGTIFLDEIGELPLETQVKLLRVLQEREFEPVGSNQTRRVDVRVIAATNRDLEKATAERRFRSDLYFRLNVLPLTLPPLRERREDITALVQLFTARYAREMGKRIDGVARESLERLRAYDWPGNIRELQNVVERAVVLAEGPMLALGPDALPAAPAAAPMRPAPASEPPVSLGDAEAAAETSTLEEVAKRHVLTVLEQTRWVVDGPHGAATQLGINPSTLRSRMKKLGLRRPRLE